MGEKRESILAALKYPLVFYGLALLVVEVAFGAGLAANSDSVTLVIIISSWMGILFLVSILVVAFLVYQVPTHIMLESQEFVARDAQQLRALKRQMEHTLSLLLQIPEAQGKDPKLVADLLDELTSTSRVSPETSRNADGQHS